ELRRADGTRAVKDRENHRQSQKNNRKTTQYKSDHDSLPRISYLDFDAGFLTGLPKICLFDVAKA
ncbi:hypothetical protein SCB29_38240, partial [Paraburkholderia sp. SIMBA_055]